MILFSHPTGNANVREAARALNEAGLLSEFWTSVCWNRERLLNRVLPHSVTRELERRSFSHIGRDQLRCHPWIELGRLAARQFDFSSLVRHETGMFSVDAVYRSLDKRVARRLYQTPDIRGVYAYEDGALVSFRTAQQLRIKTVYELPIGYWKCYRELIREEVCLQPEWAATLQGSGDSDEKLERKDEELALADDIVVASEFVRDTLGKAGRLSARVSVVPYGAPEGPVLLTETLATKPKTREGKLRVLFVGALTQRKGLSYLLEAVGRLGLGVELTLIGRRVAECPALDAALAVHRWIPSISHAALLEEMTCHDVMVFPSLFEGFGLVILEAMSRGVPVIATPNTAAPDFLNEGEDGFIVPIRDPDAITEKLEILMRDRDRLSAMGQAAILKAQHHSWELYRQRLAATVHSALLGHSPAHSVMAEPSHPEVCPSW